MRTPETTQLKTGLLGICITAFAVVMIMFAGCVAPQPQSAENQASAVSLSSNNSVAPNIIIILVDTLRRDHVGCYGYDRDTTPNIDAFARDGIVLQDIYSTSSWTMPAVMSLFTGLYPAGHETVTYNCTLPAGIPTLASVLQQNGYETCGIVSNVTVNHTFGFNRGFDRYDDSTYRITNEMKTLPSSSGDTKTEPHAFITSPVITRLAGKELRRKHEKPFFIYVHYTDPHYSYIPPAPYDTMFDPDYKGTLDGWKIKKNSRLKPGLPTDDLNHLIALYDGEIRWTDKYIGQLLETIKEQGLYDNSLILLTADHGEEFLEHGGIAHGKTLYNEVVRIPAIVKFPRNMTVNIERNQLCSLVDIMPTVLDALGYDIPTVDGVSLLNPSAAEKREGLVLETKVFGTLYGAVSDTLKVLYSDTQEVYAAYDIRKDSKEKHPVKPEKNSEIARLVKEVMVPYSQRRRSNGSDDHNQEQEVIKMLESLEYMQK